MLGRLWSSVLRMHLQSSQSSPFESRRRGWWIAPERQRNPSCGCSLRSCQNLGESEWDWMNLISVALLPLAWIYAFFRFWHVQGLQRSKAGEQILQWFWCLRLFYALMIRHSIFRRWHFGLHLFAHWSKPARLMVFLSGYCNPLSNRDLIAFWQVMATLVSARPNFISFNSQAFSCSSLPMLVRKQKSVNVRGTRVIERSAKNMPSSQ